MKAVIRSRPLLMIVILVTLIMQTDCARRPDPPAAQRNNPIKYYAAATKAEYSYKPYKTISGKGYTTHILRMVSGTWLTPDLVQDPEWWHWVHIVVPDSLAGSTALLVIGGGKRDADDPKDASAMVRDIALHTGCIAAQLHNVPNQPLNFANDSYGRRSEDELIAFGWRKFLEAGGGDDQVEWLARLPMTRAAIRAMDAISDYAATNLKHPVDHYVVAGGSKRGWTTWGTAIADDRVVAIAPIVIDLLNLVPSFQHHWRAYGQWSSAVDDYVHEGIMEWMGSVEFDRLLAAVDPYSYRQSLTLPKMLINASGDEFFLPDSWRYYWNDLVGEKHIRYVPNTGHSLDKTDAGETLDAFFHSIVTNTPRPDFAWKVENSAIVIQTRPGPAPQSVKLWQAVNDSGRDFRVNVAGKNWTATEIPLAADGSYRLAAQRPEQGWKAFFAELTYPGPGQVPFKLTSGVVVVPDALPFTDFQPKVRLGTRP